MSSNQVMKLTIAAILLLFVKDAHMSAMVPCVAMKDIFGSRCPIWKITPEIIEVEFRAAYTPMFYNDYAKDNNEYFWIHIVWKDNSSNTQIRLCPPFDINSNSLAYNSDFDLFRADAPECITHGGTFNPNTVFLDLLLRVNVSKVYYDVLEFHLRMSQMLCTKSSNDTLTFTSINSVQGVEIPPCDESDDPESSPGTSTAAAGWIVAVILLIFIAALVIICVILMIWKCENCQRKKLLCILKGGCKLKYDPQYQPPNQRPQELGNLQSYEKEPTGPQAQRPGDNNEEFTFDDMNLNMRDQDQDTGYNPPRDDGNQYNPPPTRRPIQHNPDYEVNGYPPYKTSEVAYNDAGFI